MGYDHELADRIRELIAGEQGLGEQRMFGGVTYARSLPAKSNTAGISPVRRCASDRMPIQRWTTRLRHCCTAR